MVEAATFLIVAVGLAFLFFGATFSSYGVSALGLLLGGGGGYFLAPTIAAGLGVTPEVGIAGGILAGAVVGAILSYILLSMAVAAMAFVIGVYVGLALVAGMVVDGGVAAYVVAFGFGLVMGVVGMFLTKTMMVLLTAFVGAALASRSVTGADLSAAAATLDPAPLLFELTAPVFAGLFVLGVLTQFGLFKFGYVTRLLGILPGVRALRDQKPAK